jgi:ATP-dependent Clp protease ATP-binding subunit ClpC
LRKASRLHRRRAGRRRGAHAGPGQGRVPARVLNRIDEIVNLRALTAEQVEAICELMVAAVAERLREERGIGLDFDPELLRRPATERFDPEYVARPLKRHVRRTLERELTRAILDGRLADGTRAVVRAGEDGSIHLAVAPVEEPEPAAHAA